LAGRTTAPETVEHDGAVLLSRDADARDARAIDVLQHFARGRRDGIPPLLGVLLDVAGWQTLDERVRMLRARHGAAGRRVDDQRLRALRADVEAEEQRARGHVEPRTPSRCSTSNWSSRS
jgi:hypothetical protein